MMNSGLLIHKADFQFNPFW